MTTKKFIKEMMCLGASRNCARELAKLARKDGLSNAEAYYTACEILFEAIFANMRVNAHVAPAEESHENS